MSRTPRPLLAAAAFAALTTGVSQTFAAAYEWDPTDATAGAQGGSGAWTTSTPARWWDGSTNVVWTNTGPNDAVFGGTAGTVTVNSDVTMGNFQVNTSGYIFSPQDNSRTLTLATFSGSQLASATFRAQLNNNRTFTFNVSGTTSLPASLQDNGTGVLAVTKSGNGSLTLNGTNAYSGAVTLTAGTLVVGSATALGSGTAFAMNGGTLDTGASTQTYAKSFTFGTNAGALQGAAASFTGDFVRSGSGTRVLTVNNTGLVTFGSPTSRISLNTALGGTSQTLTIQGTGNTLFDAPVHDLTAAPTGTGSPAANKIEKAGSGTLTLERANFHSGGVRVTGGTVAMGNDASLGTGLFEFNGGTLDTSATTRSIANNLDILNAQSTLSGGTSTFSGIVRTASANSRLAVNSSSANWTGTVYLGESATLSRTLTLSGTGRLSITGAIENASVATTGFNGLALAAGSSLVLTIEDTNQLGGFAVNAGSLYINGSVLDRPTNATPVPTVSVASGATLGGDGVVRRNVDLSAGAAVLDPGSENGVGTLTIGNGTATTGTAVGNARGLTLRAGNTIKYSIGASSSDLIATDLLALPTSSGNYTLLLHDAGGAPTESSEYTVLTWLGADPSLSGQLAWLLDAGTTGWDISNATVSYVNATDSTNGGSIVVTGIVVPEPASLSLLALGAMGLVRRRRAS